jgi:hypothetical protein
VARAKTASSSFEPITAGAGSLAMAVDAEDATVAVPVFVTEIAAVALAVAPALSLIVTEIV